LLTQKKKGAAESNVIWKVTCARAGAAGIILAASKAPGTEIIMDSKLIGYGIDDSNGAAYTSIGTMIEANESKSYLPILKREGDRKGKQKKENTK
jgi:hypothetical protein